MGNNTGKAKIIALNGIMGALAVVCVLLADVMPTGRLSLYALSSFFAAVSIMESGIRAGWLFYLATGMAAFAVLPEKLAVVPYVVFFGPYGIVKYYIEKIGNVAIEQVIKFAYFNACLAAAILALKEFAGLGAANGTALWIIVAVLEVVFFIYDFVYTLFINYYRERLKPKLKI